MLLLMSDHSKVRQRPDPYPGPSQQIVPMNHTYVGRAAVLAVVPVVSEYKIFVIPKLYGLRSYPRISHHFIPVMFVQQLAVYIKRIIGLPGETVQIVDGNVYIDGEEMKDHIYVSEISYAGIAEEPVELGEEEYFVIGDNAGASDDSRTASIGNVSLDDIYGKVWFAADFGDNFGFVKD